MLVEAFTEPYRHWIVQDFIEPAIVPDIETVPPRDWPGWEVRYDNDCERGKRTVRPGANLSAYWQILFQHLTTHAVVRRLSLLTEVPLRPDDAWHGAGLHVTEPCGFLACHLDYALHESGFERRINLVIFLNPTWKEEWGGAFELYDDAARKVVKRVYPAFNRAVIWEAGDLAYHGTQATTADAPDRVTAACYYLSEPRPGCVRKRALFVPQRG